ncbi:DUF1467 family protein [Altererythrobacter xixiisoli]|uniref:DUF1467 family protein n=1 Tax=Croceibacterium xixiisoli TaxID=1476466 RepID=A0A6I4TXE0_9SPHN|nr:DUF1467 family protein [Croceibacterium xixiisoli]MXO99900.1 DUF1467 family protein [Croceibacterium xixiisoli]
MKWTSILAIYLLIWTMSAFIVLPLGIRTDNEEGKSLVPGQAPSAPSNFRPWQVILRATVLATALCALFVLNYKYGWIGVEDINMFGTPPNLEEFDYPAQQ